MLERLTLCTVHVCINTASAPGASLLYSIYWLLLECMQCRCVRGFPASRCACLRLPWLQVYHYYQDGVSGCCVCRCCWQPTVVGVSGGVQIPEHLVVHVAETTDSLDTTIAMIPSPSPADGECVCVCCYPHSRPLHLIPQVLLPAPLVEVTQTMTTLCRSIWVSLLVSVLVSECVCCLG